MSFTDEAGVVFDPHLLMKKTSAPFFGGMFLPSGEWTEVAGREPCTCPTRHFPGCRDMLIHVVPI